MIEAEATQRAASSAGGADSRNSRSELNYVEITDVDHYGYIAWKLIFNGKMNEQGDITWAPLHH